MAGKKPAKGNSSLKTKEPEQPGKLVKYIGAYKGVFHTCPTCSSKVGRGFLYEFQNAMYCTRGCIPKI